MLVNISSDTYKMKQSAKLPVDYSVAEVVTRNLLWQSVMQHVNVPPLLSAACVYKVKCEL